MITCLLAASQKAAGAVLEVTVTVSANTGADDVFASIGMGVKSTNTAPAAVSDFAHHDGDDASWGGSAYWDNTLQVANYQTTAPALSSGVSDRVTATRLQRLDTNYVAGRYLFGYCLNGAGAIMAASQPYHIR